MSKLKKLQIALLETKIEKLTGKKVIYKENEEEYSIDLLTNKIKEWSKLAKEIEDHKAAFEAMIADKLKNASELEDKVYKIMKALDIKTHKVDNAVAKIVAGAKNKEFPPSYKQLWETSLTKVNEATRNVLLEMKKSLTEYRDTAEHYSLKLDKGNKVNEGVLDTVRGAWDWVKNTLSSFFKSVKDFSLAADELEAVTKKI
jgi:hypothetical protein